MSTYFLKTNGEYLPTSHIPLGNNRIILLNRAVNPMDMVRMSQLDSLKNLDPYIEVVCPPNTLTDLYIKDITSVRIFFHIIGTYSETFFGHFLKINSEVHSSYYDAIGISYMQLLASDLTSNNIRVRFNNTTSSEITIRYRTFET